LLTWLVEADRVRGDVLLVVPAAPDDLAEQAVEQGLVGAGGVQDRRGLRPAVHVGFPHPVGQLQVDAHRPALPRPVRRPLSPRIGDPIIHDALLPVPSRRTTPASAGRSPG
jgi:hypothetical protein